MKVFVERHLQPGESVVTWAIGSIGEAFGSGDKQLINGVLIVTQSRVAFYRKGFLGEVLQTMPLKSITSIERKSTLGFRSIKIHTSHDDLNFKLFGAAEEQALVAAIEAGRGTHAAAAPAGVVATSSSDHLDVLRKLGELKQAGVLTEEEFQRKKAELLAKV